MRLLTTKIWRAFPELDQFGDAECRAYLKNAKKYGADIGCGIQMLVFVVVGFICIFFAGSWVQLASYQLLRLVTDRLSSNYISNTVAIAFVVVIPWICALLTRDMWLRTCVRKQLKRARCDCCDYSLIGLPIHANESEPEIICPECGKANLLSELNLTEPDINPARMMKCHETPER